MDTPRKRRFWPHLELQRKEGDEQLFRPVRILRSVRTGIEPLTTGCWRYLPFCSDIAASARHFRRRGGRPRRRGNLAGGSAGFLLSPAFLGHAPPAIENPSCPARQPRTSAPQAPGDHEACASHGLTTQRHPPYSSPSTRVRRQPRCKGGHASAPHFPRASVLWLRKPLTSYRQEAFGPSRRR